MQDSAGVNQKQYPLSMNFFNGKLSNAIFSAFQASVSEWRCFESCMDFLEKSMHYMSRKAIREQYLPCLLENMKTANHTIKLRIINILVHILTKIPDFHSRSRIHHFLNEELATSKTIQNRKFFIIFCSKIC